MNVYRIKCLIFTANRNIKMKCEIDGKTNFYSRCTDCGF